MEPTPYLITAVDHPSSYGRFEKFLDELRSDRSCRARWAGGFPVAAVVERLSAPRMLRLGATHGDRLIAVAAVANDGCTTVAVLPAFRRRGVASRLMEVAAARTAALGYPPLHRMASGVRLAG